MYVICFTCAEKLFIFPAYPPIVPESLESCPKKERTLCAGMRKITRTRKR